MSEQRRFHAEGEIATARGAAAAQAAMVIAGKASTSLAEIVAAPDGLLWYGVYADDLIASERRIAEAASAGCKVLCVAIDKSTDAGRQPSTPRADWAAIERVRKTSNLPMVIKGIADEAGALAALDRGAQGLVVSSRSAPGPQWIEILPAIADRVGGRAAVIADGHFRRGSDILKALILGPHAVFVAHPVMWALASYGADGVRAILELLQSDLARPFGAIGAPNASKLTRDMVRVHRR